MGRLRQQSLPWQKLVIASRFPRDCMLIWEVLSLTFQRSNRKRPCTGHLSIKPKENPIMIAKLSTLLPSAYEIVFLKKFKIMPKNCLRWLLLVKSGNTATKKPYNKDCIQYCEQSGIFLNNKDFSDNSVNSATVMSSFAASHPFGERRFLVAVLCYSIASNQRAFIACHSNTRVT